MSTVVYPNCPCCALSSSSGGSSDESSSGGSSGESSGGSVDPSSGGSGSDGIPECDNCNPASELHVSGDVNETLSGGVFGENGVWSSGNEISLCPPTQGFTIQAICTSGAWQVRLSSQCNGAEEPTVVINGDVTILSCEPLSLEVEFSESPCCPVGLSVVVTE